MSNGSLRLIEYVLTTKKLTPAKLAGQINVTKDQISKWQAGEFLDMEHRELLLRSAGLFDTTDIDWALFAKTEENARAWYDYVRYVAQTSGCGPELEGLMRDDPESHCALLIMALVGIGARIEPTAPEVPCDADGEVDDANEDTEGAEIDCEFNDTIAAKLCNCAENMNRENATDLEDEDSEAPLTCVLGVIIEAWGHLHTWFHATFTFWDTTANVEDEIAEDLLEIQVCLLYLAIEQAPTELLSELSISKRARRDHIHEYKRHVANRIHNICVARTKCGLPITDDYFELLRFNEDTLADRAFEAATSLHRNSIMPYLPYGQRLILERLDYLASSLHELHRKVDTKKRRH